MREPTIAQCEQEIVALRDMLRMGRAENERLRKDLNMVADVAHSGGLVKLSEHDALVAIRRLSVMHWRMESSEEKQSERLLAALGSSGSAPAEQP